jgi:hypothetical protein
MMSVPAPDALCGDNHGAASTQHSEAQRQKTCPSALTTAAPSAVLGSGNLAAIV